MRTRETLDLIRILSRKGDLANARARILSVPIRGLNRPDRLQLAFLSTQSWMPRHALRLLFPVVRPEKGTNAESKSDATQEEKAEYARALLSIGASEEGLALLKTLDSGAMPRILRFMAQAYILRWDWQQAIPLLERACEATALIETDRLKARLLLGSALLHGRLDFKRSRTLFSKLFDESDAVGFVEMKWDSSQLLAQSYYLEGRRKETLRYLARAEACYGGNPSDGPALFMEMFRTLSDLREARRKAPVLARLETIRRGLFEQGAWERVRSCDFYRALQLRDPRLVTHLYHGTPFRAFRRLLLERSGTSEADIPADYDLKLGPSSRGNPGSGFLEVLNGGNSWKGGKLKPGQLPQRLLAILTSDFYRRLTLPQLHGLLHPGIRFNPNTSQGQVWQSVRRLREWLRAQKIPVEVLLEGERCFLAPDAAVTFRLQLTAGNPRQTELHRRLREAYGGADFSAAQLETLLEVTRPTAIALLRDSLQDGAVTRHGRGPRVRYRLSGG